MHVDHLLRAPYPVVFGYVWDLGTKIKERGGEKDYRIYNSIKVDILLFFLLVFCFFFFLSYLFKTSINNCNVILHTREIDSPLIFRLWRDGDICL